MNNILNIFQVTSLKCYLCSTITSAEDSCTSGQSYIYDDCNEKDHFCVTFRLDEPDGITVHRGCFQRDSCYFQGYKYPEKNCDLCSSDYCNSRSSISQSMASQIRTMPSLLIPIILLFLYYL